MKDAKQARDGERPFQPFIPLDMVPPDTSQARRPPPFRALLVFFVLLGLIGVAALTATALRRRDAVPATLASPGLPVVSASASTAAAPSSVRVDAGQAPMAAPTTASAAPTSANAVATGTLVFPKSANGHRRFIDGRVNESPGRKLELPCGPHEVRIGSRGTPRVVEIPCGGETELK